MTATTELEHSIAIIGMDGRFPGAADLDEFWSNLCQGVESVSTFSDEQLLQSGTPRTWLGQANFVRAAAMLDDADRFDAAYFGYSPRDAELIDPQQRLMLETASAALENAGYGDMDPDIRVGVFVGSSMPHYAFNLYSQGRTDARSGSIRAILGNSESHLATRISYKLNLRGPSMFVQSACSTSLLAIHLACRSLLTNECDIAIAGGVSVTTPRPAGYLYMEGGVLSPDGHCRAFDADARGTIIGNGVGAVILRRLPEALKEDTVYAVVRGSAANNDGGHKIGYTAPSQDGQVEAIREAISMAGIPTSSIGYIEAHGTGTELGDPIEVAALTEALGDAHIRGTQCALGSLKTNMGHMLAAAGVGSFIKTVLALIHGEIPPSLHYSRPNPKIDFDAAGLFVNERLRQWPPDLSPRRAGVSSFGIGGTNVHVVLEQAPAAPVRERVWAPQLLPISARTGEALAANAENLASHLARHPDTNLADVAYTLQFGRATRALRKAVVCLSTDETPAALRDSGDPAPEDDRATSTPQGIAFLFSGQGNAVPTCPELYDYPEFRASIDRSAELAGAELGFDLRQLIGIPAGTASLPEDHKRDVALVQPAMLALQHALACQWMAWVGKPSALLGHSLGEIAAACISGVFSHADAIRLVILRGRVMRDCPPGAMLAVGLSETKARERIGDRLALSAVNSPQQCVVGGDEEGIAELEHRLANDRVWCQRLAVTRAFHTPMMNSAVEPLRRCIAEMTLSAPDIPLLSSLDGDWLTTQRACDPGYWTRQMTGTVRFAPALEALVATKPDVFLELGPGRTLSSIARPSVPSDSTIVAAMPDATRDSTDLRLPMLRALGRLWETGVDIDWREFHRERQPQRVPLPTYAFQRQRYWVGEKEDSRSGRDNEMQGSDSRQAFDDWFYIPAMRRTLPVQGVPDAIGDCVVFAGSDVVSATVLDRLRAKSRRVLTISEGPGFRWLGVDHVQIRADKEEDYDRVLSESVGERSFEWRHVLHIWSVDRSAPDASYRDPYPTFDALVHLARALGRATRRQSTSLTVVTDGALAIGGESRTTPAAALAAGPCRVMSQELPDVVCRQVDVMSEEWASMPGRLADHLIAETADPPAQDERGARNLDHVVALRERGRWIQTYEPVNLAQADESQDEGFRVRGVYLVTGGLGGIGFSVAGWLCRTWDAQVVVTTRSPFPARTEWNYWIDERGEDDTVSRRIRQIMEVEVQGGRIHVRRVDVADLEGMRQLVTEIENELGTINGVIHAAGLPGGGMIQRKPLEEMHRVLSPKVIGQRVLEELFRDRDLDFVLLCSSLASIRGGFGQTDYCAANAFLDASAQELDRAAHGRWISINWGAWAEVGMAVRALQKYNFLPCPFWLQNAQPDADSSLPHPFLDRELNDEDGSRAVRSVLDAEAHWPLRDHRLQERPTWPGTGYLELVRASWAALETDTPASLELSDLRLMSPLSVQPSGNTEVFTVFEPDEGNYELRIASSVSAGDDGDGEQQLNQHVSGRLRLLEAGSTPTPLAIDELIARTQPLDIRPGRDELNPMIHLGPRWNCLVELRRAAGEAMVRLQLPAEFEDDLSHLHVHPALLDTALGASKRGLGIEGHFLPFAYQRVRIHRPMTPTLVCHARLHSSSQSIAGIDVTLCDDRGDVILEIENYQLRRIDPAHQLGASAGVHSEEVSRRIEGAIRTDEGMEVFRRIVVSGAAQVIVSPLSLDEVIRKWKSEQETMFDQIRKVQLPSRGQRRTGSAVVASGDDVEATLRNIWGELLGIDRIDPSDDFFSLGGDSLLAIHLHASIQDHFDVDVPLATIFEATTLASQATTIREATAYRKAVGTTNQPIRRSVSTPIEEALENVMKQDTDD